MKEALQFATHPDRAQLETWAKAGKLFALIDPFFEIRLPVARARLDKRDTDPIFYDVIAWDKVTYQPPYIAHLTTDALAWILNCLSTERWGIFVVSERPLEDLCRHFQKFVIARGPDANPYFLRFHDASVLEVLLSTWEPKETAVFFAGAEAFGLPDLDTMEVRFMANPFALPQPRTLPLPEDCLLQLREPQLRACAEAIDRDLVKVIYWHLRNHHAKSVQFLEKGTLETRIQHAIAKGRHYALGTVSDLAGFAALMFELAPNFDDHPSFRSVLTDPEVPSEQKMKRLSQVITDREWNEALSLFDRSFWSVIEKKKR